MAACRFVQLSDIHLGHQGFHLWYNYQLFDHATTLANAAIDAINAAQPEFVVVTGDLTHTGTPQSFAVARAVLDRLEMPYYVLPGNHDVPRPGSRAAFNAAFQGHVPPGRNYQAWECGRIRCLTLDAWWLNRNGTLEDAMPAQRVDRDGMALPAEQLRWLESELEAHPDATTLIFIHFPLVPVAERFMIYNPRDCGYLRNGKEVLAVLGKYPQVRAVFCGHKHFNQTTIETTENGQILHSILCSNIEYPMMWREIAVDDHALRFTTHLSQVGNLRELSLHEDAWVYGAETDRNVQFRY